MRGYDIDMQAIFLAAGMGKRLGKHINKCMLGVGDTTIFDNSVIALKKAGITRLIVVTGYHAEQLEMFITERTVGMDTIFVRNKDYASTNNIWSLYLAKDYLAADDTVLLESDLFYRPTLIKELVDSQKQDIAVVSKWENWMDGTTVTLHGTEIEQFISKQKLDLRNTDDLYKTVNIYKLSKQFSSKFFIPEMSAYISEYGKNDFYELVLGKIVQRKIASLFAHIICDKWYEIDTELDLKLAIEGVRI